MSRKRDSNWNRDEITVLLDSIMEITRSKSIDGKQINSKEVFEYAAKQMEAKGHNGRAEPEKCRTKWKKMKEEYVLAKRAQQGDPMAKIAPGIQPFYDRIEEFVTGDFDNICPNSTIVKKSTCMPRKKGAPMRTSARIAANVNHSNNHNDSVDTTNAIAIRSNTSTGYSSEGSPSHPNFNNNSTQRNQATNEETCIYTSYNNNSSPQNKSSTDAKGRADISYRVSPGFRQITIFGDHDVDIKFRGDRVTINKIVNEPPPADN